MSDSPFMADKLPKMAKLVNNYSPSLAIQELFAISCNMDVEDIPVVVRQALAQQGTNAWRLATDAGLPGNAVRHLLDGHEPKAGRLIEICRALGLEFYIGPQRNDSPAALATPSAVPGELERPVQALVRMVANTGGNPIPDDLWPMLDELRRATSAPLPTETDDPPKPGLRVIDGDLDDDPVELDPDVVIAPFTRDIQAAAGGGAWVYDDAEDDMRVAVPRSFLPGWAQPKHLSCIRASGDSMEPDLNDGDLILIDHSHLDLVDDAVFVIHTLDGLVVKRVRKIRGGWEMASDNPAYKPRRLEEEDHNVGRVAWSGPLPATEAGG